jgi:hypothetical protein
LRRVAKLLRLSILAAAFAWGAIAFTCESRLTHGDLRAAWDALTKGDKIPTAIANEDDLARTCPVAGPKGPWDHYQTRDLPRGNCSGAQACTLWTRDSCPGADYPGPAIKWRCVCSSGAWQCHEEERTRTVCGTQ